MGRRTPDGGYECLGEHCLDMNPKGISWMPREERKILERIGNERLLRSIAGPYAEYINDYEYEPASTAGPGSISISIYDYGDGDMDIEDIDIEDEDYTEYIEDPDELTGDNHVSCPAANDNEDNEDSEDKLPVRLDDLNSLATAEGFRQANAELMRRLLRLGSNLYSTANPKGRGANKADGLDGNGDCEDGNKDGDDGLYDVSKCPIDCMDRKIRLNGGLGGWATHEHFSLRRGFKGRGIATSLLRTSIPIYREMGLRHIYLTATGDGSYVWPKFGFKWTKPNEIIASIRNVINNKYSIKGWPEPFVRELKSIIRSPNEATIWKIMDWQTEYEPWKRMLLRGQCYSMSFDLNDAKSMDRFHCQLEKYPSLFGPDELLP